MGESMKRLAILIPWDSPFVWTDSVVSIMNLEVPPGFIKRYFRGRGWCAAQRHNDALRVSSEWEPDAYFFAGGDEVFERDTIPRLYKHLDKYDMVSGMIPSRGVVEGKPFPGLGFQHNPFGDWVVITEQDKPQEIHVVGTGILLCRGDVFDVLPAPYFTEEVDEGNLTYARTGPCDTRTIGTLTLKYDKRLFLDTTVRAKHLDAFQIDFTYQDRFSDLVQ
jgi:hypothetical protein